MFIWEQQVEIVYFLCDIMHDAMLYLIIDCIYKCKFSNGKGWHKKKVLAVSLKRNFLVSDFFLLEFLWKWSNSAERLFNEHVHNKCNY